MTLEQFKISLSEGSAPEGVSCELLSLWHDAKGNWEEAHTLVQDETTHTAARVHAYLHRKEGDDWNARYWYRVAVAKPFTGSFEDEWNYLVSQFTSGVRHVRAVSV